MLRYVLLLIHDQATIKLAICTRKGKYIATLTCTVMLRTLQDMVDTTMLISQLKFITVLQTDTHAHLKCAYGYISNIWESIAFFVITLFVLFAFIWNCF